MGQSLSAIEKKYQQRSNQQIGCLTYWEQTPKPFDLYKSWYKQLWDVDTNSGSDNNDNNDNNSGNNFPQ